MKRFVIISTVVLLICAAIFGFSLHYYFSSDGTVSPRVVAPESTAPAPTPTEELSLNVDMLNDHGIFSEYYEAAAEFVEGMTTEQMVGQMILGVTDDPSSAVTDISRYSLSGVLFEETYFDYMSKEEVASAVRDVRSAAPIAPILAVQEEGGNVNTVSSHSAFDDVSFDSPRDIYEAEGLSSVELIEDAKTTFLKQYGFNLNLAPVVDLPDTYDQIMYSRSLSSDAQVTSTYAEYVSRNNQAKGVSVALKHFPGYGTIPDTDDSVVVDTRDATTIRTTDYTPFKAGASAGAHFIMISNVVVRSIDPSHTAALSPTLHRELRDTVGFTGLIITDILDRTDYSAYADGRNVAVAAVLAGNDMILVRDYASAYRAILDAVNNGTIGEDILKQVCTRIIAYKYAAGLLS